MKSIFNFLNNTSTSKIIQIIIIVGLIVFANSLFNEFVWDDKTYILNNIDVHKLNLLPFEENMFNNSGQYRPLAMGYFSLLYNVFQTTPFFYHTIQLAFHIINSVLLFLLFKKFLGKSVSLFLSIIFLIHPIQIESVTYISASGSVLNFFFGIIALYLVGKEKLTPKYIGIIYLALLFSMLIKESGFIFLFLVFIFQLLLKRRMVLSTIILSVFTLATYLFLRIGVGQVFLTDRPLIPIARLTFFDRLITIPEVIFYYIKMFFLPLQMNIAQFWIVTEVSFFSFYFPLLIDLIFFFLIAIAGVYIYKKKQDVLNIYLFFCIWFVGSLLIHSQIIPLDATVADRWFYTSLAGLLGLIGIIFKFIIKPKATYLNKIIFIIAIILMILLATRTVLRNSDWNNPIKLYTRDLIGNENFILEEMIGAELSYQNKYAKAIYHHKRAIDLFPTDLSYYNLGYAYEKMDNIAQARIFYEKALITKNYIPMEQKHYASIYQRLGNILVYYDDPKKNKKFLNEALEDYPDDPHLLLLLAITEYKLNNNSQALIAAQRAYSLSPNSSNQYVYKRLLNNQPIIIEFNPNNLPSEQK